MPKKRRRRRPGKRPKRVRSMFATADQVEEAVRDFQRGGLWRAEALIAVRKTTLFVDKANPRPGRGRRGNGPAGPSQKARERRESLVSWAKRAGLYVLNRGGTR